MKTESRRPEFLKAVLDVLDEGDGEVPSREIFTEIERRMQPTTYEAERLEKTGHIRWRASLQFDSIRLVKAGWLRKKRGMWYLTEEGRRQTDLSAEELLRTAREHYRKWRRMTGAKEKAAEIEPESEQLIAKSVTTYEQALDLAKTGIHEHIQSMGAYDFQDLVAALLRGMGYHVPFVAPPGKDGGIDVLAYSDPFGTKQPRIKVQVKHRQDHKVNAREVRELRSLLNKPGDNGLSVSTAGFTTDARSEIAHSPVHIEKVDLDQLINLWEDYYDKLCEEDKALLPLRRISFLAPIAE